MTDSPSGREGDSEQGPEDLRSDSKKKSAGRSSLVSSSPAGLCPGADTSYLACLQIMSASRASLSQTVVARTASERRAQGCRFVEKFSSRSNAHALPSQAMLQKNSTLVISMLKTKLTCSVKTALVLVKLSRKTIGSHTSVHTGNSDISSGKNLSKTCR